MKVISFGFSMKLDPDDFAVYSLEKAQEVVSSFDSLIVGSFDLEYIEYDAPARTINVGLVEVK